ncbi:MAG: methyltransferase [Flammeovirgaceae bacterium]|nr:methyltransferase [Flammeovirgaceae bacterium]HCX22894.1 methyltransferase [Cytophagales bacterium]
MEIKRSPFQGVSNVIRFNWHFYVIAAIGILILFLSSQYLSKDWEWLAFASSSLITLTMLVSLMVTYYVYDFSELYELKWLDEISSIGKAKVLNINAGFDETSSIIATKFKDSELHICDFYDPRRHTEISIKRARKAYPPNPKTLEVKTNSLPYSDGEFEVVCVSFAAHEIRSLEERKQFFRELARVTNQDGKIFVTEHLRDPYNFLAYTIGFLHFFSRKTWMNVFNSARLQLIQERKTTAFVSTFILSSNGATS